MSKARFKCILRKVSALMLLDILMVYTLIFTATASSIGVQVGVWAKYSIVFEYNSSPPNQMPSNLTAALDEATTRDWNNVTVQAITGSDITLEVITHVKNGTIFRDTYVVNILTGEGTITFPILVVPNLKRGDAIIDDPSAPLVNRTSTMTYAGANRQVNFVPIISGTVGWDSSRQEYVIAGGTNGSLRYFYFDQKTGLLCQFELFTQEWEATYTLWTRSNIVLTQTNLWAPDPYSGWQWWLAGAVIISAPVMLFYYSRTRKKKHHKIDRRLTKLRQNQTSKISV